jgi:hypothetical protein
MKKLLSMICLVIAAIAARADNINVSALTSQNVAISLSPNGALDGVPVWGSVGPGILQVVPGGMSATLVTAEAGTNVVTVSSGTLSTTVTVTVIAPPATTLGVSTHLVGKQTALTPIQRRNMRRPVK